MLTRAGRRTRVVLTVAVAALTIAGTLVGQDDDFPFGPFRMYSTRDDPDGTVVSTRVEARDATGRLRAVDERSTGLSRAEVEGQVRRFVADPELLGALSRAHDAAPAGRAGRSPRCGSWSGSTSCATAARPARSPSGSWSSGARRDALAAAARSPGPGRRAAGRRRTSSCRSTCCSRRPSCGRTRRCPGELYVPLRIGRLLPLPTPGPVGGGPPGRPGARGAGGRRRRGAGPAPPR